MNGYVPVDQVMGSQLVSIYIPYSVHIYMICTLENTRPSIVGQSCNRPWAVPLGPKIPFLVAVPLGPKIPFLVPVPDEPERKCPQTTNDRGIYILRLVCI
jgi:hypothetical protein